VSTAKPCILIVDDEREVREICSRSLKMAGYDTQAAESAHAAMALIEASSPDAILLDLKMPFESGLAFLHRLRAAHPHIPVAIVTGISNMDDATQSEIRALNADLRFKPLRIAEIQVIARDLLARRRQE
jgi:DNA-binding NtrC family response regulator